VRIALEALYDAADDDSATSGPDLTRRIFPVVAVVTSAGVDMVSEDSLAESAEAMLADRMRRPGGPRARVDDSQGGGR
jgi:proteasome beta subunit